MAQILISGDSLTIKSEVKYDDLKDLMKYAPDALSVYDEDDKEVFKVEATDGLGSASPYGICFSGPSLDGSGKAVVTLPILGEVDADSVEDYVFDEFGVAVDLLNELEASIPEALHDVEERKAAIRSSISIVG